MTKNILLRELSEEEIQWLDQTRPPGVTQKEQLQQLIAKAREDHFQQDLFQAGVPPRVIHGKLPFKFIDLFAGIGGFRSAMTALGGECVFTSEWDKYAVKTYREWYGDDDKIGRAHV